MALNIDYQRQSCWFIDCVMKTEEMKGGPKGFTHLCWLTASDVSGWSSYYVSRERGGGGQKCDNCWLTAADFMRRWQSILGTALTVSGEKADSKAAQPEKEEERQKNDDKLCQNAPEWPKCVTMNLHGTPLIVLAIWWRCEQGVEQMYQTCHVWQQRDKEEVGEWISDHQQCKPSWVG